MRRRPGSSRSCSACSRRAASALGGLAARHAWRRSAAPAAASRSRRRSGAPRAHGLDDARAVALSPDGKTLYAVASAPASVTSFSVDAAQRPARSSSTSRRAASRRPCRPAAAPRAASRAPRRSRSRPTACTSTSPPRRPVRSTRSRASRTARSCSSPASRAAARRPSPRAVAAPPRSPARMRSRSRRTGASCTSPAPRRTSLVIFARDAATGRLQPLTGPRGLPARGAQRAARPSSVSMRPRRSRISPDGTSLYVTSAAGTLTAFAARPGRRGARAADRHRLPQRRRARPAAPPSAGSHGASAVAVSPDGRTSCSCAATDGDSVVVVPARPRDGRARARVSCVAGTTATAGCAARRSCSDPRALAVQARRPRRLGRRVARRLDRHAAGRSRDGHRSPPTPGSGAAACAAGVGRLPRDARARRPARPRREPRRPARLRRQRRQRRDRRARPAGRPELPRGARDDTPPTRAHSVVLACSDPNGDKIALDDRARAAARQARRRSAARPGACATRPRRGTPAPTRSRTRRATAWT